MPAENHIEVCHQDASIVFALVNGGYCIANNKLAVSVEAERLDGADYPNSALFCIFDFPVSGPLKTGMSFTYKRSGHDLYEFEDRPKGHAYFQFHVEDIETTWTVTKIEGDDIWFSMEATHDDIDYYDGRAKPTPTRGLFRLRSRPISELWIP